MPPRTRRYRCLEECCNAFTFKTPQEELHVIQRTSKNSQGTSAPEAALASRSDEHLAIVAHYANRLAECLGANAEVVGSRNRGSTTLPWYGTLKAQPEHPRLGAELAPQLLAPYRYDLTIVDQASRAIASDPSPATGDSHAGGGLPLAGRRHRSDGEALLLGSTLVPRSEAWATRRPRNGSSISWQASGRRQLQLPAETGR